jgi:hypothetical protein
MYYGHNRSYAPRLRNYKQALALYNEVKPIRGREGDVRPMGKRSADHKTIRLNEDGSVACRLYSTDVVTFHEDKVVVYVGGHATKSTVDFLNDVLTVGFCRFDNHIWMHATVGKVDGWYPLIGGSHFVLRLSDKGFYSILENPVFPQVHEVNRKAANNVRAGVAHFKTYVRNMLKLRGHVISNRDYVPFFGEESLVSIPSLEVQAYRKPTEQVLVEFTQLVHSRDPLDQNRAFLWLAAFSSAVRWYPANEVALSEYEMLYRLDRILLYANRDVCFRAKYIQDGTMKRDRWADFF